MPKRTSSHVEKNSKPTKKQRKQIPTLKNFSEKEFNEICVNGNIMTPISEDGIFGGLIRKMPHRIAKSVIRLNILVPHCNYAGLYLIKDAIPISTQQIVDDLKEKEISIESCAVIEISGTETPMAFGMYMNIIQRYAMEKALEMKNVLEDNEKKEIYVIFK